MDLPPHVKSISSKWIYKVKYRVNGTRERYRVRLVAKIYNQIECFNFFDTFSHVAKLKPIRTLLATDVIYNWLFYQLGVNNAFLHGELKEDMYITIPKGVFVPWCLP